MRARARARAAQDLAEYLARLRARDAEEGRPDLRDPEQHPLRDPAEWSVSPGPRNQSKRKCKTNTDYGYLGPYINSCDPAEWSVSPRPHPSNVPPPPPSS